MELLSFCLLDTKTGIHHPPFFVAHVGLAIRAIKDLGSDLNTSVGRHPADYQLVQLGTFDDNTGQTVNAYQPVATVVQLVDSPPRAVGDLFRAPAEA